MKELNTEIIKMLDDLETYKEVKAECARKAGPTDPYGYPFEAFDAFNDEPLSFLENAMKLYSEAGETYLLLRQINRHSPLFYQMSEQLEKLVNQLGSVCVTKAAMEHQTGEDFEMLSGLTIDWLRGLTAFNFRKSYKAFMETNSYLQHDVKALTLSIRWSALDKRLLATDEKIKKIMTGEVTIDLAERSASVKKDLTKEQCAEGEKTPAAIPSKSSSLPVDKSALRQMAAEAAGISAEQAASGNHQGTEEIPAPAETDNMLSEDKREETAPEKITETAVESAAGDRTSEFPENEIGTFEEIADKAIELPNLSGTMFFKLMKLYGKKLNTCHLPPDT